MGAVVNGMTLSHLRGYGSTFLVFADYMRAADPARRRSWNSAAVWVFTHDSIGVGEDGPTHQPIEHLATLRAIPGLDTIRPGDANEVAGPGARRCETTSIADRADPLAPGAADARSQRNMRRAEGVLKGAYVLADSDDPEADPDRAPAAKCRLPSRRMRS